MLVDEAIGNASKALLKTFRIFFYKQLSRGFKIHQDKQNLHIQEEFRKFAISVMGARKYYIAHGHVYLDDDQGRVVDNYEICPLCGDGGFFLTCEVCHDGNDDVDLLVADLATRVNFNDDEINDDDPAECDDLEEMPLVFDTEDHTHNFMVIEPEETEADDKPGNDNNNNSAMMETYSPPIPLTLSFPHFCSNNPAGEKKKRVIFGRKELRRGNDRHLPYSGPVFRSWLW